MRPYASTRLRRSRKLSPLPTTPRQLSLDEAVARVRAGEEVEHDSLTPEARQLNARLKFAAMDGLPARVRRAVAESLYGVSAEWVLQLMRAGMSEASVVGAIKEYDDKLRRKFEAERR